MVGVWDPLYQARDPASTGRVPTKDGKAGIYYELRGDAGGEKITLLNGEAGPRCMVVTRGLCCMVGNPANTLIGAATGAFSTLRHYDQLADMLAEKGYQVMTLDCGWRSRGASGCHRGGLGSGALRWPPC